MIPQSNLFTPSNFPIPLFHYYHNIMNLGLRPHQCINEKYYDAIHFNFKKSSKKIFTLA